MRRCFWLVLLLAASPLAHACSCNGPNPVCSVFWGTPSVFRGRVIERTLIRPPVPPIKDSDGTLHQLIGPGYYKVRFAVSETFHGEQVQEITIYTNEQSSACGFAFRDGAEYLVFANTNAQTQELWTSHCSLTHEIDPAKEDGDLSWLHGLKDAPPGSSILGSLWLPPKQTPPSQIRITLRGPSNRDLTPDEHGKYSANGLTPGTYLVTAALPSGFQSTPPKTVTVLDKGCVQVDWPVRFDSHIRGKVIDAAGTPVPHMFMVLSVHDTNYPNGRRQVDLASADDQGRYDFAGQPPGDYLITANSLGPSAHDPYPTEYYPGTEQADAATLIHLESSASLAGLNITMPVAWKSVTVTAHVVMPDGAPASRATLYARDTSYQWSVQPATGHPLPDGSSTLTVYEGRSYYLTATLQDGIHQRCAGPLKFTAKDGLQLEPIVVEHNWGNCLAQLNPNFKAPVR